MSRGPLPTLRGSCLCGAVRFEVTEPFLSLAQCHCTNCKKISGGTGTVNGRARSEAIRVLAGSELLRTFEPAEGSAKTFCSTCGSNLFGGGWPASPQASVRLSAVDTPFEGKPGAHIFVRSVAPWETLPDDGVPRYEVRSSSQNSLYRWNEPVGSEWVRDRRAWERPADRPLFDCVPSAGVEICFETGVGIDHIRVETSRLAGR